MADMKEIIQVCLKHSDASTIRRNLQGLSQPVRGTAIAILDDLIAETSKPGAPQPSPQLGAAL
ncbi:hypothetical protein BS47DRAFT_1141495 [Hydnum rufescens UP504]|uniref:Uncharacterized protein n=1 Tax=Hydnum rufescens UP504 TaxID=1448309 RepID=A0A9P6ATX8_9AGAM|nr:hypothetical protein BS47DRAFT_1141495 [Hydnum rufescens UP504]